jgi:hypothetical protein
MSSAAITAKALAAMTLAFGIRSSFDLGMHANRLAETRVLAAVSCTLMLYTTVEHNKAPRKTEPVPQRRLRTRRDVCGWDAQMRPSFLTSM